MKKLFLVFAACLSVALGGGCSDDDAVAVKSVSFHSSAMSLELGKSERLTAIIKPADASYGPVTWKTSDSAIVTVDDGGTVKAVAVGTATITATAGEQSATCEVTVIIPATGITLDQPTLELSIGDTHQFVATILPANTTQNTVTWESSTPATASISTDGKIEALAEGTTTITARVTDKLKATCIVTVKAVQGKVWAVGDFYEVEGVKGVVVEISNGGVNGKIVSLDQKLALLWASGDYQLGCGSETDGKANTQKVKDYNSTFSAFPAFKWCSERGAGWYMPAIKEVFAFLRIKTTINPVIKANGGNEIDDYYWSSTEGGDEGATALVGSYNNGNPSSYGDWKDSPEDDNYVRAMYAF